MVEQQQSVLKDIPFCMVFRPTEKEFEDFAGYMEKCDQICKTGIFKVSQLY